MTFFFPPCPVRRLLNAVPNKTNPNPNRPETSVELSLNVSHHTIFFVDISPLEKEFLRLLTIRSVARQRPRQPKPRLGPNARPAHVRRRVVNGSAVRVGVARAAAPSVADGGTVAGRSTGNVVLDIAGHGGGGGGRVEGADVACAADAAGDEAAGRGGGSGRWGAVRLRL